MTDNGRHRYGPSEFARQVERAPIDSALDPERVDLLEKLARWNGRLEGRGAEALVTVDEARELRTDRLGRVVEATRNHYVDLIDLGRFG